MQYKVGMYGGSFDPLHLGHVHDMIRAAAMCEELYIMISWCEGRESTSKELRYRWIHNCTKHLPNVRILLIEDIFFVVIVFTCVASSTIFWTFV